MMLLHRRAAGVKEAREQEGKENSCTSMALNTPLNVLFQNIRQMYYLLKALQLLPLSA